MSNWTEKTPLVGRSECDNCGKTWDNAELHDIRDYDMRVDEDTLSEPSGECPDPECGALCYSVKTSEKVTHTPGPWQNAQLIIEGCNGRLSICDVHDHSSTSEVHTLDEAEANAHLIAAAPEMLEALEQIRTLTAYMNASGCGSTLAKLEHLADAAIRKAKGEL